MSAEQLGAIAWSRAPEPRCRSDGLREQPLSFCDGTSLAMQAMRVCMAIVIDFLATCQAVIDASLLHLVVGVTA